MKFIFLTFLLPLQLFAQDIAGVWTGTLYNDTTRQFIKYELAISEYNGKFSGYSHTTFVFDGVENIGVKSIRIRKSRDEYLVEDEKLIYNNYTEPPAKGVKTFSELILSENDTAMILSGPFKTNTTKVFKTITGNIYLQKKKEINESLIIPKLENLGLAHSLSFIPIQMNLSDPEISKNTSLNLKKDQEQKDIAKNVSGKKSTTGNQQTKIAKQETEKKNIEGELKKDGKTKEEQVSNAAKITSQTNTRNITSTTPLPSKNEKNKAIKTELKPSPKAAAEIATRKIETVRSVEIKSDSLLLTLYDNGEIDGDTVSVLLNNKIIMPLQGLTAKGISKTIYLTPEMGDSLVLIMYAENLGSIPPNTGLLVVHDGDAIYEIRFSGDLKKNSAIILRRKQN